MQYIMGSTSAANHIHYHTYTASGAVITQNCTDGSWFGGELEIAYANDTGVGTGTASITCGEATFSYASAEN